MNNLIEIANDLDELTVATSSYGNVDSYSNEKPHQTSFKIVCQNIRSISCNLPSFMTLMERSQTKWDLVVLTECWLPRTHSIPQLQGYEYLSTLNNLTQNEGVVVYYKPTIRLKSEEPILIDANCLMLEINENTIVLAIYRPAGFKNITRFIESLNTLLSKYSTYSNIILVGDINVDITPNNTDSNSSSYLNLLASHGMLPAHTFPTHSLTCLDHVMLKTRLPAYCYIAESSITDHDCIFFAIELNSRNRKPYSKTLKKINYSTLDNDMSLIDFSSIFSDSDVNTATNYFISTLNQAIENNTSTINTSNRKVTKKPWITRGLLKCMRNRDNMHQKLKELKKKDEHNQTLEITYKRYRNFCNDLLKKVRAEYERSEISKAASISNKKLWEAVKTVTNTKKYKYVPTELLSNSNPHDDLNNINSFFSNMGKNLAEEILPSNNQFPEIHTKNSFTQSFVLLPTDIAEVEQIIQGLKNDCAVGRDNIPATFLKRYREIILPPLTYICNLAFSTGAFPNCLKLAEIHPIHKGGDRGCVNNFRPISILPTVSKILERLINKRLANYLESNKLLSPSQFGFRSGKSTSDAVQELVNFVSTNLDGKQKVLAIFLDLAKAFDTVSAPLLLEKLEGLGVRGTQLKLFSDYLTNRKQRVRIGDMCSDDLDTTYGVPQGSILGPTLFLAYINDLCNIKLRGGRIITFADDTALLFHADSWQEVYSDAQLGFNMVSEWLKNNKLTLNVSKSMYIPFSIKNHAIPSYTNLSITSHTCSLLQDNSCSCPSLKKTDVIKYLGIQIDNRLSFQQHVDALTARTRKLIFVFKNLRHVAETKTIDTVYYALVQSILSYCITAWGGVPKTSLLRLERAQRAVLKVSRKLPFLFPTKELYQLCKVLTVRQLFILSTIIRRHSQLPYNPVEILNKRRKHTVCKSRSFKTSFSRRFFCFLGDYLYNKINKAISIYSLPIFNCKTKVQNWLQSHDYEATERLLEVIS